MRGRRGPGALGGASSSFTASTALIWIAATVALLLLSMQVIPPLYYYTFSLAPALAATRNTGGIDDGRKHILVTGGAGFIGSHAALRLLEEGRRVTIIDNLSRGNLGAIRVLEKTASSRGVPLTFVNADLGDRDAVASAFARSGTEIDAVIHFAAVAYVGESVSDPIMYYKNITVNTVLLLDVMREYGVHNLVYSSTCATYGNPAELPITEETPTLPINPYGKAKLAAEDVIRDFAVANPGFKSTILRYFNVYGSDPAGRLGELPRANLRKLGRISGACFDAALGFIEQLTIMGTTHPTRDGSAVRDYIHVTDLVDAHVTVLEKALSNPPALYNVGTGKGISVKEFVDSCKKVTGMKINVYEQTEPRPGDYAEVFADPSKINKELNWTARFTNLEESMGHAWAWRKNHKTEY